MEYRINCRHIGSDCKCNNPHMTKKFGFFKRECIVIDRLEKCWMREDVIEINHFKFFNGKRKSLDK